MPVSQEPVVPMQVQRPASVVVQAGDTVYSVARRYSLSVRELIEANHLPAPYTLSAGMVLRIPGGGDYVVQRGDTLSALARRFKVDFNSFAATNNKRPPYTLLVGERLRLPSTGRTSAVASSPAAAGGPPTKTLSPSPSGGEGPQPTPAQAGTPPAAGVAVGSSLPPRPAAPLAAPAPRAGALFLRPVKGEVLAEFGPLPGKGQNNDGINIAAARGTPVLAAENGTVAYVGNELKGFGNLLLVKHSDGWMTAYAHNERLMVKRGDQVRRGQAIATVGSSGSVTTPQLHFEIRRGTEAVNPEDFL